MVHFLFPAVTSHSKKLGSLVCAILLWICCTLSGCSIIQPSREDFVRETDYFLQSSVHADVYLTLLQGETVMYFDSAYLLHGNVTQSNGVATVFWNQMYFKQQCVSICTPERYCKQWRDSWVISDAGNIRESLSFWLQLVETGFGEYEKIPVIPAEVHESFHNLTEETFRITIPRQSVDWKTICDAHIDSLFGGDALWDTFGHVDIQLFFSTDSLRLRAVLISGAEHPWIEASIILQETDAAVPTVPQGKAIEEGLLNEEWELKKGE